VLFFPVTARLSTHSVHARTGVSQAYEEESVKRLITLASLGVLMCVALFTLSLAQTPSGPSMVLPESSFDFGEVDEGRVVEHTFRVLNKGTQPLEIRKVNPG